MVATWRSTYRGMVDDAFLDAMSEPEAAQRWGRRLPAPAGRPVVVAEVAGDVVGFASGGRERDGDRRHTGELYAIYVLEAFQGRGMGRELARAVAGGLAGDGHRSMLVWALRANAAAHAFYRALGGVHLRDARHQLAMGALEVMESAFGWDDIDVLAG